MEKSSVSYLTLMAHGRPRETKIGCNLNITYSGLMDLVYKATAV
jgi:hypothetical protein